MDKAKLIERLKSIYPDCKKQQKRDCPHGGAAYILGLMKVEIGWIIDDLEKENDS